MINGKDTERCKSDINEQSLLLNSHFIKYKDSPFNWTVTLENIKTVPLTNSHFRKYKNSPFRKYKNSPFNWIVTLENIKTVPLTEQPL